MDRTAEELTELAAQGHVQLETGMGTVLVTPTRDRDDLPVSTSRLPDPPEPCGVSKYELGKEHWIGGVDAYSVNLWWNDEDTEFVVKMLGASALATDVAALMIGATGWGAIPAPVIGAFGALLTYQTLDIATTNDGCGVKMECYIQAYVPVPTYDVFPQ
jgi:hypothetical protein